MCDTPLTYPIAYFPFIAKKILIGNTNKCIFAHELITHGIYTFFNVMFRQVSFGTVKIGVLPVVMCNKFF